jgi:3-phenylpropionate/trans-cinnamate dioxygenase ferredoxin reductase subunit
VPYVWSDQYKVKIQVLGRCRPDDAVSVVLGSVEEHRFVALYERDGMLHGALGFAMPGKLMRFNPLLDRGGTWEEALELAASLR